MKLLFITCGLPHPPHSGSALMAAHHIRYLAERHTIDLISFRNRVDPSELGDLPLWCNKVELIERPPRWRVLLEIVRRLTRDPIPAISRVRSQAMSRAVNARLASKEYDVVLFQLVQAAQFRPGWYQGPTVWSFEAPIALKTQRESSVDPWHFRIFAKYNNDRLQRYEAQQAPRFNRITCLNEEEYPDFKATAGLTKVDCVPYGVDAKYFCPSPEIPRREGMIVITGNMFHRPNVDAVEHFCRDIFPRICKKMPCATLWIVGARPVRSVTRWNRDSRITVTGYVPDVRAYLRQAMVSVCPIRAKVGVLTKMLEALACGTPVVCSSAGNCGIRGTSGEHLYVADDPSEFADKVVALLSGERWSDFSRNGRSFVVENFTWEKSGAKLEEVLEDVSRTNEKGDRARRLDDSYQRR
jgi:polysaccharide biosynthesis protein PslH